MTMLPRLIVDNSPPIPDHGGVAATALGELAADRALEEIRAGATLDHAWLRCIELGRNSLALKAFVLRLARAATEVRG